MDSGNSQEDKFHSVNEAPAQNSVGGNNSTNNQNVTWPLQSTSAATVGPKTTGFGQLQQDGLFSKPKINIKSAGNLILRKQDSSFSNPPKAYALIINIFHYKPYYDEKTKKEVDSSRRGSQVDVEKLAEKFQLFNVGVYSPETHTTEKDTVIYVHASDIKRWIKDFKTEVTEHQRNMRDSKMACFVCIMGHGDSNARLIDSHDRKIPMETEIFPQFNNQHFRSMIGNPKIFFTNCCRGSDLSPRVTAGLATDGISGKSPETLPNMEDFLIGWSTSPENYSLRNSYDGSIFIRILCQLLQQHLVEMSKEEAEDFNDTVVAKNTDLETILKAVAVEMRSYSYNYAGQNCSQTPNIDNRGFAHFRWHVDHFEYSRDGWLPPYLKLSQIDKIKLRLH